MRRCAGVLIVVCNAAGTRHGQRARRHRPVLRRHAARGELPPGGRARARRPRAHHPHDARLGTRPRPRRRLERRRRLRRGRGGRAARRRVQRAHVGLARLRRVGRHGDGRRGRLRGPRRAGAARLARGAARGAARRSGRPARGHARAVLRGRHRAGGGGDRPAHRRDRARHRLALAADRALPRGPRQGGLGRGARRPRPPHGDAAGRDRAERRADGDARPAHPLGAALRRRHGEVLRCGPAVVRRPRAGRPRAAHPRADAAAAGDRRHAVHAVGGDPQPTSCWPRRAFR